MRRTVVEVEACALQLDFLPAEDEHDRPVFKVSFFDERLQQHVIVRISEPRYALFGDEGAKAEFERLMTEGARL